MEGRNLQPVSGMSDGKLSVVLRKPAETLSAVLRSGPLSPEQLADILDEPHTRRAWWLDLHTSSDLLTGSTIDDIDAAVRRAQSSSTKGSNGQPAAAPVLVSDSALTVPVCECSQPVASIRPFDWQCAKCKGVIPSITDYPEASI
jgi:hypothetical protein